MLTFALQKIAVNNNLLLQSIVEDEKYAKIYHVGKIMRCQFVQVSLKYFEYHASP